MRSFFWTRLVPLLALFKLALGLVAFFLTWGVAATERDPAFPYVLYLVFIIEFGVPAALLLLGGRGDPRAVTLGSFFLVGITAWCNHPLHLATVLFEGSTPSVLFHFADALELDCLMAFYLWGFVREFPAPTRPPAKRWVDILVVATGAAGLTLFGLNLVLNLMAGPLLPAEVRGFLATLVPMRGMGLYYSVLMPPIAAALAYLVWRGRSLADDELRRRVRVFLLGLAVGFGPMLLDVLGELFIPPYQVYSHDHPRFRLGILLVFGLCTFAVPFGTTYAVLVHRVLDVKLLARRAMQYTLARASAIALAAAPLAALVVYLYENRARTLDELFSGSRLLLLLTAALVGGAALRYRRPLLDAIDRRFFREQYDARQILTLLVDRIRATGDAASLASLIAREIDLALHLEGIALLVQDVRSGLLADPRRRTQRLDASSQLALLVANASDPLSTDLEDPRSPVAGLPDKERHWLVDSAFKLVVPILARDGSLLGLIGLGEKKSGLPFLREDRQLLRAVASSSAWVLELAQTQSFGSSGHGSSRRTARRDAELIEENEPTAAAELAKECPNCGALFPSYTVLCIHCSRRLEPSHVPYVLPGKFRFERRIGSGGMGVVYRGADLSLGRPVAVKTLRRVSPEDAMRLRREARTAAAVSHRHLAPVYGMETWQGTPMLVLELLEGGTLAQRLERGPLTPLETVELGIAVADALGELHRVDILHRDIKPSNIGFTKDGAPKLMDFGIARVTLDLRHDHLSSSFEGEEDDSLLPPTVWLRTPTSLTLSKQLVGTLSYLSPEALAGEPPDPSFDLWSLAIVLYECLLGRKVFGGEPKQVMARIKQGRVPEMSQVLPDADEELAELFRTALHKNPARRPGTARELRQRLEKLRSRLA